jgi:AcrR family transcriptional regulator
MALTAPRKSGRPIGNHRDRQHRIANVLLKVIAEQGLEKASMRAIAREARCTTGVLSHYFSNKEELIRLAVDMLFDWADHRARAALERSDSLAALEIVIGNPGKDERLEFDFWAVWLQVLVRARRNRRLAQIVSRRHGRFRDLLTRIIAAGQREKQIRTDVDAGLLADYINAISDGIGLMSPIESKRLTSKRVTELISVSLHFVRS